MSILKSIADVIRFGAKVIDKGGRVIYTDEASKRVKKWYADPKNRFYKTDFELSETSVVFDLGGFEGQWASDIYARFNCTVHVFEPVPQYAQEIQDRFIHNRKIKVYPFGLFNKKMTTSIALQGEGSSTLNKRETSENTQIELERFMDFVNQNKIEKIDLVKINIEGAEYDLLEDVLESDYAKNIDNLIIQFHDFFPDAKERMDAIRERLKQTHDSTFYHEFVWEGWKKKSS